MTLMIVLLVVFCLFGVLVLWVNWPQKSKTPKLVDSVRIQTERGSLVLEFWDNNQMTWRLRDELPFE